MNENETAGERLHRIIEERNARMLHDELRTDELIEQRILKELEDRQ
ncbi:MAG: hypothetical protein NC218_08060 [Acetobacter sp.]|nr:hypothetical protein [Acetobacter sp.]